MHLNCRMVSSVVVVNKTAKKQKQNLKIKYSIKQNKTAEHKLRLVPCELSATFFVS